jgi:hypothetical protein
MAGSTSMFASVFAIVLPVEMMNGCLKVCGFYCCAELSLYSFELTDVHTSSFRTLGRQEKPENTSVRSLPWQVIIIPCIFGFFIPAACHEYLYVVGYGRGCNCGRCACMSSHAQVLLDCPEMSMRS